MQGGQGDVKHWAFNDPPRRKAKYKDSPPSPGRVSKTHYKGGRPASPDYRAECPDLRRGNISLVPAQAISVGPAETWQAEKVSIWQAGNHDNPFGQPVDLLDDCKKKFLMRPLPMSLLADHPNVQFNYYRKGIGTCDVEMH